MYVTDLANVEIDANDLRRQAIKDEQNVSTAAALDATWKPDGGEVRTERILLVVEPHPIYGTRWWFRCPRCGARRGKLYVVRAGTVCRGCLHLGYARPSARRRRLYY